MLRADDTVSGITCAGSLNTNGTQTILFKTLSSSTAMPSNVSQVGIDVILTAGQSDVFDGARGYFVFRGDSDSYCFDMPIEFKNSADGVIGFSISSIDASRFLGTEVAQIGRAHV